MKITHLVLSIAILIFIASSCSNTSENQSVPTKVQTWPEGTSSTPYPDNPNLERVIIKNEQGKIGQEGDYYNGLPSGTWVEYHPNGMVKSTTAYIEGKKQGLAFSFNNSGQVTQKKNYLNNELHGAYQKFKYSNVKEERFYVKGKLEGVFKMYYDDGSLLEESTFKNGKREGTAKWYDEKGENTIEYIYENGAIKEKIKG